MTFATLRNLGIRLAVVAAMTSQMTSARCEDTIINIDNFTFSPAQPGVNQTVFFNVTGAGGSQTLSAQTGRDGVAQLRGLNLPAGTYTVTAYFLGVIPFDTGKVANPSDERYSASVVSKTVVADVVRPSCAMEVSKPSLWSASDSSSAMSALSSTTKIRTPPRVPDGCGPVGS